MEKSTSKCSAAEEISKTMRYRRNYIFSLLEDGNREAGTYLEKVAAHHKASMLDICMIYNIFQLANRKSEMEYPAEKIASIVDVVMTNAASSNVDSIELAKRITPNLFRAALYRWELDASERETRKNAP